MTTISPTVVPADEQPSHLGSRRAALHLLPVAVVAPAMVAATELGEPTAGRLVMVGSLCAIGWVLAVVADDLFGHDAQIDRVESPRLATGGHLVLDTRLRTRHVLLVSLVLASAIVLLVRHLDDDASSWFRRVHTLTAVLALSPCAPFLRSRRRGLAEVAVTVGLALCVPALVLGSLVADAPADWLLRLSPVGVAAGGTVLVHTAASADWDRRRQWASLPARLGATASRDLGAAVVVGAAVLADVVALQSTGWRPATLLLCIAALALASATWLRRRLASATTVGACCSLAVAAVTIAGIVGS